MKRFLVILLLLPLPLAAATSEFCLDGEFDLGARYQGLSPAAGEWYPLQWCVISEDGSERVMFRAAGYSNPDMQDTWTVAYLPPEVVRIVNREAPPDVEFRGAAAGAEAARIRRLDPRRLAEELRDHSDSDIGLDIHWQDGKPVQASARAEMPLRGAVYVAWQWHWQDDASVRASLSVDGQIVVRGTGDWRQLSASEAADLWQATPGADAIEVPGDRWPARVAMRLIELADGVWLLRGVRTGFQHLVVDTDEGLVIGDAPAGWLELHQLPPTDLVPGLGVSGLSQGMLEYLQSELPGRSLSAVALTHFHDDHAGGARAFAAAGADIYAPASSADFLEAALNRDSMPPDALGDRSLVVKPVPDEIELGDKNRVRLLALGGGPHAEAMLGLWAVDAGYFFVSDVHVPRDDEPRPRPGREITECWFARWAVENLPLDVQVVNSHSDVVTPVSRLAEYLLSDGCRSKSAQDLTSPAG